MINIDKRRKIDNDTLNKLQNLLQANVELLNAYDFKKLYDVANKSLIDVSISDLTYLLVVIPFQR